MSDTGDFGSFFRENKDLAKEYIETRLEIYRLRLIGIASRVSGYFVWIIISLFLLFLLIIFLGLVAGFWLSEVTGSNVAGFGIVALLILIKIIVLAGFRRAIFVDPIIRNIVKKMKDEDVAGGERKNKN
jgi:hypothetical protein